jgi:hypothetical protein
MRAGSKVSAKGVITKQYMILGYKQIIKILTIGPSGCLTHFQVGVVLFLNQIRC